MLSNIGGRYCILGRRSKESGVYGGREHYPKTGILVDTRLIFYKSPQKCRLRPIALLCHLPALQSQSTGETRPDEVELYLSDRIGMEDQEMTIHPENAVTIDATMLAPVDKVPRRFLICMSSSPVLDDWRLVVATMELYRWLGVDLMAVHIKSVTEDVLKIIRAYERRNQATIRSAVDTPRWSEKTGRYHYGYSSAFFNQISISYECYYEFRESANFIAMLDWGDFLVPTNLQYTTLYAVLRESLNTFSSVPAFILWKRTRILDAQSGKSKAEQI